METINEAFVRFTKKRPLRVSESGCLIWTGATSKGYGWFNFNGKMVSAHRAALQIKLGRQIKEGLVCAHLCNNPSCVNPNHLEEQTADENQAYKVASGNSLKGEKSKTAKLTEEKVLLIRTLLEAEAPNRWIARQFGVREAAIRDIRNSKTWRHVK